jgi:hypothetical protein
LAWTGEEAVAVWIQEPEEDQTEIQMVRYAPGSGFVGEPVTIAGTEGAGSLRLLWTEAGATLVWTDARGRAYQEQLQLDGTSVGRMSVHTDASSRYTEPAFIGGRMAMLWDSREGLGDAALNLAFQQSGILGPTVLMNDAQEGSVNDVSELATDGDVLGVAWSDDRGHHIYASFSDADGRRASTDLQLGNNAAGFGMQPAITGRDGEFTIVWRDTRDHPGGNLYLRKVRCGLE